MCTLLVPVRVLVCVVYVGSLYWGVFIVHTACQMGVYTGLCISIYVCVCVCVCAVMCECLCSLFAAM